MNPEIGLTVNEHSFVLSPQTTYIAVVKINPVLDHILLFGEQRTTRFFRELFESNGEDYNHIVSEMDRLCYGTITYYSPEEVLELYVKSSMECVEVEYLKCLNEEGI